MNSSNIAIQNPSSFSGRLFPVAATHFVSVFNENAFRVLLLSLAFQGGSNSFGNKLYVLSLAFACILPYVVFCFPAGFLTDRLPKRYILIMSMIMDAILLGLGLFFLKNLNQFGWQPLILTGFCQIGVMVFYFPALYAMLPEMFSESRLQKANGWIGGVTFIGSVSGAIAGTVLVSRNGNNLDSACWLFGIFSLIGIYGAVKIPPVISLVLKKKELLYPYKTTLKRAFYELTCTPSRLLAVLGDNFFLAMGAALLLLLIPFARMDDQGPGSFMDVVLLQAQPVFGIALGCVVAGLAGWRKIELGLVPFGAAGVAVSLLFAATRTAAPAEVHLMIPYQMDVSFPVHSSTMCWLFLAGFSGGLFMIPLRAYYQLRFNPEARGCALALNNVFQQIMIVLIDTVLCMFCANFMPTLQESGRMPDFLMKIAAYVPSISAQNLIISLGIATLLVTLLTMWMLPDFCLRFIVITLSHTVYRIRKIGTENIPSRGPVMLISNHISIVDAILIGSCTSRRVRFLLDEEYFSVPMISLLVRLTGFIKVPSAGAKKEVTAMYETVKEALCKGEIVCVFPEGWMSHNGVFRRFKGGYEKMIPPEIDVPLIPVYIGQMWGSMFSYYKLSRRKLHFPRRFPFFVSLTFGTPMKKGIRPFEVRQKIAELSAEQAMIPLPFERTIHYHLARYAKQAPFRIAMRDADGHEEYSYFRTFREAVLLSMSIRRMTPSSVKYVGILLPNSTDAALSIFSVLIADKTPCPLNYSTSQEIFELSVKKAGITHIITTRKFLQGSRLTQTPEMIFLEDLKQEITRFGRVMMSLGIILCPYRELINILAPLTKSNFSATAVLLFSSGSTGNPKGVMLSHHNMYTDAVAIAKGCDLKRTDKIAGNLPLFHSYGVNVCFWMPFLYGQEVIYSSNPLSGSEICGMIEKYRCTLLFATPSFLQAYLRKQKPEQLQSLRGVFTGAEKLRSDTEKKYLSLTGGTKHVTELYGSTELAPVVTINLPGSTLDLGRKTGPKESIGIALENMALKVVDPITYEEVPPKSEGLLFAKGPMVMQGYLGEPEATRKVMFDGYYNTGDIAKMNEAGYIFICGRLSRFSKIAGEMVPHEMVERIIAEICQTDIRVAAVGSIDDRVKGEALAVLYVPEMPLTPEQVVDQMREYSISNLWIPKVVNFYPVDHLPLLGSGKLDLSHMRNILNKISEEKMAREAGLREKTSI